MKKVLATVLIAALPACVAEEASDTDAQFVETPSTVTAALDKPTDLPTPGGACPEFNDGYATFHPSGMAPRRVRLYMSPAAKTKNGPLIFYWHGTSASPEQAIDGGGYTGGFGPDQLNDIKDQGGIIAAPEHDPDAGQWPWFFVGSDSRLDDLRVADEVVACAVKKVGINTSRIHSIGFSAGGLQTTQMSYRRSNYIASVATYSGGYMRPMPNKDPSNKFAAMIFYGGPGDFVGMSFQDASNKYHQDLKDAGHFSLICNHNGGHSIPPQHGGVWQFFQDHPYGVKNSYPGGLPAGIPDYCQR